MVSCLPDKRAPGGAPFLVRRLLEEYIWGELRLWRRDGRERFGQRCGPAPRKKEKQVISEVQGSAPRLSHVSRTSPAIELLTSVNKAGGCAPTRPSLVRTIPLSLHLCYT